jgi:hypothetical protein
LISIKKPISQRVIAAYRPRLQVHVSGRCAKGHGRHQKGTLVMKTDRFAGYNEAREALALAIAGVTAITLVANLILIFLY